MSKHKMLKAAASDIENTRSFSKSVLSEVVVKQLTAYTDTGLFDLSPALTCPQTLQPSPLGLGRTLFNLRKNKREARKGGPKGWLKREPPPKKTKIK